MNTAEPDRPADPTAPAPPDPETCRRARLARDPRFDGEFFLAVRTTGIYCRPVCPARPPSERNVHYYRSAAQAAQAGYRPCLRCRPESAPQSPAWLGTATTVRRALQLIEAGALNEGSLGALAARLGVGERYLRKLFQRQLGVSPTAVAHNQRLLFARKLLAETDLPITEVAFAAGFTSVRRFNGAVRAQFRQTPSDLRRRSRPRVESGIRLQLHYRPPYDWGGVRDFFARHAVAGIEQVQPGSYRRRLSLGGFAALIEVRPLPRRHALELYIEDADHSRLMQLVSMVRRMFDLDANPAAIAEALAGDPLLEPLLHTCPGVRAPGWPTLYEATVRAIVGQQISTVAARSICARLTQACAGDARHPVFPSAAAIAELDNDHFPMPARRRESLQALCRQYRGREEQLDCAALEGAQGVGAWTLALAGMRGSGDPDVFPARDLGLERAWQALGGSDQALTRHAGRWRPWRTYAANLLWRSLNS